MHIQITPDHNIKGSFEFLADTDNFEKIVQETLNHFKKYITKVEIHFTDENASKTGFEDKRCLIEARIRGLKPIIVTHHANNLLLALDGATEKLKHSLDHTFGKMKQH